VFLTVKIDYERMVVEFGGDDMAKMDKTSASNFLIIFLALSLIFLALIGSWIRNKKVLSFLATFPIVSIRQDKEVLKLATFVDLASEYLTKNGEEKAYQEFRKVNSKWRLGNTYLFVYDMNGKALFLPAQANLEGTNRLNAKDIKGKYFVREMISGLRSNDSGWLMYYYIKPGNEKQFLKLSYFKKVNVSGKTVLIGSGIYLE